MTTALEALRRRPTTAFVLLNTVPTALLVACATAFGWSAATAGLLAFPLNLSPVVTALFVTRAAEGPEGVRRLVGRFAVGRVRWALVALAVFPLLAGIAHVARILLQGGVEPARVGSLGEALVLAPFLLLFPGLTEELGWRGFLQPRLQQRIGAFGASLAVGVVWAAWHAFDLVRRPDRFQLDDYGLFALYVVATSGVLGWIWNRSRGSVSVAIVGHFGANVVNFFVPMGDAWVPYFAVLAATPVVLLALFGPSLRGWRVPARSLPDRDLGAGGYTLAP